jgi:hypothetical protein
VSVICHPERSEGGVGTPMSPSTSLRVTITTMTPKSLHRRDVGGARAPPHTLPGHPSQRESAPAAHAGFAGRAPGAARPMARGRLVLLRSGLCRF